jgi:hypothetical protein
MIGAGVFDHSMQLLVDVVIFEFLRQLDAAAFLSQSNQKMFSNVVNLFV